MPLIVLTGYPTSGKTFRAKQLRSYLESRISALPSTNPTSSFRVHVISDHTLAISRSVYNLDTKGASERSNNASEKDARAAIYAAVKRVLSAKDIVILDGANYIKGWRYQLHCESKQMRTPHCVVHVGTPVEKARQVNQARLAAQPDGGVLEGEEGEEGLPYDPDCWENLVFRYEEPNSFVRWDSPLFTVPWDDELPPCDAIWDALIGSEESGKKIVRPNAATVTRKPAGEGYLYELDRTTQSILNKILEWTKDHSGEGGGEVIVEEELVVDLPANPIGFPALQRLRRQFISLNRTNTIPLARIGESFVGYLNDSFEAA